MSQSLRALIFPEFTPQTETISTSVVSFADWTTLTKWEDDHRVTHYRVNVSGGSLRYTTDDSDPSTTVGNLFDSSNLETRDFPRSVFAQMKVIRDGLVDAEVVVTPLHLSVQTSDILVNNYVDLDALDDNAIAGAKVADATTSSVGVVQLASEIVDGGTAVPSANLVYDLDSGSAWKSRINALPARRIESADYGTLAKTMPFGYGDFSIVHTFALDDWTPSGSSDILLICGSSGNNRLRYLINISGSHDFIWYNSAGTFFASHAITISPPLTNGKPYTFVQRFDRSGYLYVEVYGDSGLVATGSVNISSAATIKLGDLNLTLPTLYNDTDTVGIHYEFEVLPNRLLTADEGRDIAIYGKYPADCLGLGGLSAQTSGTLTTNKYYILADYITGDDFTNVGVTNADWSIFKASGTTPTTWTNSSTVYPLGQYIASSELGNPIQTQSANENQIDWTGSTVVTGAKQALEYSIRDTLTWAGTTTSTQVLARDLLDTNTALINLWLKSTVSTTVNVGDEASATRFASAVSLTANEWVKVTLLKSSWDGTNGQIKLAPTASLTGSIEVKAQFSKD